jgi:predicted short-subunit dehydrogenase-like oxidoreductase (DUF2520 family)
VRRSSIAIIGAGRLGSALAASLRAAGYPIVEVVSLGNRSSLARARSLARCIGARAATSKSATLGAGIIWFCVPDAQIGVAAQQLAERNWKGKIAIHSSGVLGSDALSFLRKRGADVASAHPLMTFVRNMAPDLSGVSFAIEGDKRAVMVANKVVRNLGGEPVRIRSRDKVAYHAFATMICPLLVSLLATSEDVAGLAGISPGDARRRMLPIIRQTIANYEKLGPAKSFTGPIVRGDVGTIQRHLDVLSPIPGVRDMYVALARAALRSLPNRNAKEIREMLRADFPASGTAKSKALTAKAAKELAKSAKNG